MKKLTKVEEEIMQLAWELGPTTVSNLISKIKGERPPHSTISSVMRILEEKGFLNHNTYGKTFEYYPIVSKEDYSNFSLDTIISRFFDGQPKALVSFLIKNQKVRPDELKDLVDLINSDDDS